MKSTNKNWWVNCEKETSNREFEWKARPNEKDERLLVEQLFSIFVRLYNPKSRNEFLNDKCNKTIPTSSKNT